MQSPFIVGAEVYIDASNSPYTDNLRKARIAKVYKNGNFIVEGGEQQYRPYEYTVPGGKKTWQATPAGTGHVWTRCSVLPANEETTRMYNERKAANARKHRAYALQQRIHRMSSHHFTDAQLDAIEAALDGRKV